MAKESWRQQFLGSNLEVDHSGQEGGGRREEGGTSQQVMEQQVDIRPEYSPPPLPFLVNYKSLYFPTLTQQRGWVGTASVKRMEILAKIPKAFYYLKKTFSL